VTQKAMYVFVWKAMQNAKKVIDAKIGEDGILTDMRVLHIHCTW
jgi:hypothetical protein